eukprot:gb/GEZJ01004075.1/.p3 GENE.gb/GEZJ01004075.1/~~gb/GEZJ01004075.1/.p3  ORF type:complete len:153 (+),score=22.74 gb/GEZJ01004075.1/:2894-3352(+)
MEEGHDRFEKIEDKPSMHNSDRADEISRDRTRSSFKSDAAKTKDKATKSRPDDGSQKWDWRDDQNDVQEGNRSLPSERRTAKKSDSRNGCASSKYQVDGKDDVPPPPSRKNDATQSETIQTPLRSSQKARRAPGASTKSCARRLHDRCDTWQ